MNKKTFSPNMLKALELNKPGSKMIMGKGGGVSMIKLPGKKFGGGCGCK